MIDYLTALFWKLVALVLAVAVVVVLVVVHQHHAGYEHAVALTVLGFKLAALVALVLGWDATDVARQLAAYDREAARLFAVDA